MATEEKNAKVKFNPQDLLWDYIDLFKNPNPKAAVGIAAAGEVKYKRYKNFLQLQDRWPYLTQNRLSQIDPNIFNTLTNQQMSALTPYIKLYKEEKNGSRIINVPFPFGNFTSVDDASRPDTILKSNLNRGVDAGIKAISFRDLGTNPSNVGYNYQGNMQLYFQSLHGVFIERNTVDSLGRSRKINFSDILDMPRIRGRGEGRIPSFEEIASINAKKSFQLKMEIGWSVPPDPDNVLGFDENMGKRTLREAIETSRRSYLIHNTDQELKIDNKDGSATLNVTFVASIEAVNMGPRADLLYIDPDNEADPYSVKQRNLIQNVARLKDAVKKAEGDALLRENQLKRSQNDLSAAEKSLEEAKENPPTTSLGYKLSPEQVERFRGPAVDDAKARVRRAEANLIKERDSLNKLKSLLKTAYAETRSLSYQRIINTLRIDAPDPKDARYKINYMRYVDLSKSQLQEYLTLINNAAKLEAGNTDLELKSNAKKNSERQKGLGGDLKDAIKQKIHFAETGLDFVLDSSEVPDESMRRVHYFYLGDLVEGIARIIYKKPRTNRNTGRLSDTNLDSTHEYQDIRIMLGSFTYTSPLDGKTKKMAMADIPVSFDYLKSFLTDNITKSNRNSYPLHVFLKDLCSKLISNLFNANRYGGFSGYRNQSVRSQILRVPKENEINKIWNRSKDKIKNRVDISKLYSLQQKNPKSNLNVEEWIYISIGGSPLKELANLHRKNKSAVYSQHNNKFGIPHLYIGSQRGILRDISFKRIQIPYRREAVIQKQQSELKRNLLFMDKYDANINVFGSAHYIPGMLVYVDPVGLGLTPNLDKREWAAEIGIGGYYRIVSVEIKISESEFSTTLVTKSELDFRDIIFDL